MEQVEASTTGKGTGKPPVSAAARTADGASARAVDQGECAIHDGARTMASSLDGGVEMLKDWQELMRAGLELVGENIRSTATDLKDFSECRTPEELSKASATFSQSVAKRWLDSSNKFAALSNDYASNRFRASTKLASAAFDRHREG